MAGVSLSSGHGEVGTEKLKSRESWKELGASKCRSWSLVCPFSCSRVSCPAVSDVSCRVVPCPVFDVLVSSCGVLLSCLRVVLCLPCRFLASCSIFVPCPALVSCLRGVRRVESRGKSEEWCVDSSRRERSGENGEEREVERELERRVEKAEWSGESPYNITTALTPDVSLTVIAAHTMGTRMVHGTDLASSGQWPLAWIGVRSLRLARLKNCAACSKQTSQSISVSLPRLSQSLGSPQLPPWSAGVLAAGAGWPDVGPTGHGGAHLG